MAATHRVTRFIGLAASATGFQYGYTLAIIAAAEPFLTDQFQLSTGQLRLGVSNLTLGRRHGSSAGRNIERPMGPAKVVFDHSLGVLGVVCLVDGCHRCVDSFLTAQLAGFAVGSTMIMPLYVAEIAPAKVRGLLVSLIQIGIVTGILVAFCVGWKAAAWGPTSWRWMFGLGVPSGAAHVDRDRCFARKPTLAGHPRKHPGSPAGARFHVGRN